jgi:chromosome segregation ATPase
MEHLMDRTCEQCGKTFKAKRADARLCGPACRQTASRAARGIKQGRKRAAVQPQQRRETLARLGQHAQDAPADLDRRITAFEARLATIEGKLVAADRSLATTTQKQASMEQRGVMIEATTARIPGIETSAATLAGKVKEIRVGLNGVRADLAEEVQARQELATDILTVSQQMAAFAEAVVPGRRR